MKTTKQVYAIIALCFMAANPAIGQPDSTAQINADIAVIMENALYYDYVVFVEVEVVGGKDYEQQSEQDLMAMPPNMLEILMRFQAVDLQTTKVFKGQVEDWIYIEYPAVIGEGFGFDPFYWIPGSRWVMMLENPFDDSAPKHDQVVEDLAELNAANTFREGNFFTLHEFGFGAVCLQMPDSLGAMDGVPFAGRTFPSELKIIVDNLKYSKSGELLLDVDQTFRSALEDEMAIELCKRFRLKSEAVDIQMNTDSTTLPLENLNENTTDE